MLSSWRAVVAAGTLAAVGAAASAQPVSANVRFEVSADGGATWGSQAVVQPGDRYRVRAMAGWVDGSLPANGLGVVSLTEIRFAGATQAEFTGFDDLYKFLQSQSPEPSALYDIPGGVKIDNARTPADYRLNFGQYSEIAYWGPNPFFQDDNPIRIFEIEMTSRPEVYDIAIDADYTIDLSTRRRMFRVYMDETSSSLKFPNQPATLEPAHVTVAPAPGTLAMAGLGMGLVRRGRRPSRG